MHELIELRDRELREAVARGVEQALVDQPCAERALLGVAGAGCGNDVDEAGADWPRRDLKIMAPADPGGGWDTTAREMARVIEDGELIGKGVEVYNVSGAGGTIGLAQLAAKRKGEANQMMVMGLVMLGAIETNQAPSTSPTPPRSPR